VPSRWGRAAGDSGPSNGSLLLTSQDGDPNVDIGVSGTFTGMPNTGIVVCSFDFEADQDDAVFKASLGIDKGADIVGLTFDRDGSIEIPGRSESFPYLENEPYRVYFVLTWLAPTLVRADVGVVDKITSVTVASWSFTVDQAVTGVNRLLLVRKGGTPGSFTIDSINASWMFTSPGH
jgi:hypothetical protein